MKSRFFIILATAFLIASIAQAGGISKGKLLEMSSAKLDPETIANMLEAQGVDFAVTPDVLVELKRAGVDGRVLTALSKMAGPKAGQPPLAYRAAADLYRAGNYEGTVAILETHLTAEPRDHPSRALLATTYLRLHKRDLASQELERLKTAGSDRAAAAAVSLLQNLIAAYDTQEALREKLKAALQNHQVAEAFAALDRMKLSDLQKQVLRAYVAVYQGSFDEARRILAELRPTRYAERSQIEQLQADVSRWETTFRGTMREIDKILFSGIANSDWCDLPFSGKSPSMVEDYLKRVSEAAQLAPIDARVMDLSFHAGVIALDYPRLEALGDRILKAKGEVRVPGYDSSRFFYLVIDKAGGRIYTAVDSEHAYTVKCVIRGFGSAYMSCDEAKKSLAFADLEPFDLRLSEVTRLQQKADGRNPGGTMGEFLGASRAVELRPRGCVPEWSLMNVVHQVYGPAAQKRATQNLGKFVLHVIGNPSIKASLADPGKTGGGGLETAAGMAVAAGISVAGARYGNTGLQELGKQTLLDVQQVSAQRAADERTAAERSQVWFTALAAKSMRLWEDDVYADIEKLLELVN